MAEQRPFKSQVQGSSPWGITDQLIAAATGILISTIIYFAMMILMYIVAA
jgi:hypothetical protein